MVDGRAQLELRDQRAFWLVVSFPEDDSQYELGTDWPEDLTTDEWSLYHGAGSRVSPAGVIYQDEMLDARQRIVYAAVPNLAGKKPKPTPCSFGA